MSSLCNGCTGRLGGGPPKTSSPENARTFAKPMKCSSSLSSRKHSRRLRSKLHTPSICAGASSRCSQDPSPGLWLPCEPVPACAYFRASSSAFRKTGLLLVTVGHLNPNKRIHAVIDALGRNSRLAENLTYAVLGPADPAYHHRLQAAVKAYGLEKVVRFLGYVSDQVLQSYVTHADACVNLRYPAHGGRFRIGRGRMMQGKAMLVTDTGFFAELPDHCVLKVNPAREQEELAAALERLLTDPSLRAAMGAPGRGIRRATFRPSAMPAI